MAENQSDGRRVASDINHVLDFGTGIYDDLTGGILDGFFDWMDDPTGKKASQEGLAKQIEMGGKAIDFQRDMYGQNRQDLMPWMNSGVQNLGALNREMGQLTDTFTMQDFMTDPGYQFRLSEGEKAINRAMGAKGLRNSTAAVKSLNDYSQGMASSEYSNAYNRFNQDRDQRFNKLFGMAGMGQDQSRTMAQMGSSLGSNVADIYTGMGNAYAGEAMNRANFNQGTTGQVTDFGMGMLGGLVGFCDERVKTNIKLIPESDLEELRDAIKPYAFNYASDVYGEGDWVGPMAQDLEKTKLGKTLVEENEEGIKMINMNKVGALILATMGKGA